MMKGWKNDITKNTTDTGCKDRMCMDVVLESYLLSEPGIRTVEHCSAATVLVRLCTKIWSSTFLSL
jgi:hypothetical protein